MLKEGPTCQQNGSDLAQAQRPFTASHVDLLLSMSRLLILILSLPLFLYFEYVK